MLGVFGGWLKTNIKLKENKSIDAGLQKQMVAEKEHWKKVLERLIEITIFFGKNNLTFRGSSDKLLSIIMEIVWVLLSC